MTETNETDVEFATVYAEELNGVANRWARIEAIATDAVKAGLPITGVETCAKVKKAVEAAGVDRADSTIQMHATTSKYMAEATAAQRKVFRRYPVTSITEFARTGHSQEAAHDFLKGKTRKQLKEIKALTRGNGTALDAAPKTLDEMAKDVLGKYSAAFKAGSEFSNAYESAEQAGSTVSAHAATVYMIQQDQTQRAVERAIREALASA